MESVHRHNLSIYSYSPSKENWVNLLLEECFVKRLSAVALLGLLLLLAACSQDTGPVPSFHVSNYEGEEQKVFGYTYSFEDGEWVLVPTATGRIAETGEVYFDLSDPPANSLEPLYVEEDGITFSDPDVQGTWMDPIQLEDESWLFPSDPLERCEPDCTEDAILAAKIGEGFTYVDRTVTITANTFDGFDNIVADLELRKGWHFFYYEVVELQDDDTATLRMKAGRPDIVDWTH